ncbi:MAG: UDP-N-acetylmuramoyl-tripeptide--D-alanyl-D-alanine ligase [Armatimonadota bacterium]
MVDLPLDLVLSATGGRLSGGVGPAVLHGVSTDTRTLKRGALFVALKGERFDGHDFVAAALDKGAGAALVSREIEGAGPLIIVADSLIALGALAAAHRAALSPKVIAVTGSTGKTSTKEMLVSILSQGWKTARTPGNYNTEVGVPLALLDLDDSHQAAVIELAMRGKGQIDYLARMTCPQVAVITNVGLSHLELLGTRDAIAEAKAELLAVLPRGGAAVLNADDDFFALLSQRSPGRVVSFGRLAVGRAGRRSPARRAAPDVTVHEVRVDPDGSTQFTLHAPWGEEQIALSVGGRHHALNAAAAAAAAVAAGADPAWIAPGLASFSGAEKRTRIVAAPSGFTVIDDSYNAAPDSMRAALELLEDLPGKRKWAVLGDMKELGPMAPEWHREIGEQAAASGIAGLVALGELGHYIAEGARRDLGPDEVIEASGNAEAAAALLPRLQPGDVVLVKGSRAMGMEQIVARLLERPADG